MQLFNHIESRWKTNTGGPISLLAHITDMVVSHFHLFLFLLTVRLVRRAKALPAFFLVEMTRTTTPSQELDVAYQDLRRALVEGQVRAAEEIGERIGEILAGSGEKAPHDRTLGTILQGMGAVLSGDFRGAAGVLGTIAPQRELNPSLRWAASLWSCWAALELGDVEAAQNAAEIALDLSRGLDPPSRAVSLSAMAEAESRRGDHESAMERLLAATEVYTQLGDTRGLAAVSLAQARIHANTGQDLDAVFAGRKAKDLAPDWEEPTIFLATQGLKEGNLDRAERRLAELDALGPRPQEAQRLASLIRLVRDHQVPLWVVAEYLRLRDALATEEVLGEIRALMLYSPQLYHLQEELAWKMIKLGKYDAALPQLETLNELDLDPSVRASVILGLSSLASLSQRKRPPGAQVRAAVLSPTSPEPRAAEAPAPPMQSPPVAVEAGGSEHDQWIQRAVETIAGKKAVFSGDLGLLSMADLLEFLRNGRRTGTLVLQSELGTGAVYVRSGLLTNASSPGCGNIGDLLLESGAIQPEQLREVADHQRTDGRGSLMGALFVERGIVDADTMKTTLTRQVFTAIRELFQWKEGQFAFLPDPSTTGAAQSPSVDIELDPQFVLLEVARNLDEENR